MSAGEPTSTPKHAGSLSRLALRAQPDTRLVSLAREGHDAAFEEIVRRYRAPLVRFAGTIVAADAAEDAVQEGLMKAHKAILADDSEIALRAWLYTIVRNGALSQLRRLRPAEELDESINGVPQPPDIVERRERVRGLVADLKDLPEGQREALVRTELGGESADRIAAALETSPAGVGQLVFRARTALRGGGALLLPMPAMRALLELGKARSGGATAGGVLAGAIAGGGGASTVVKVAALVAVAAVAVGPGRAPVTDLKTPTAIDVADAAKDRGTGREHAESQTIAEPQGEPSERAATSGGEAQAGREGDGGSNGAEVGAAGDAGDVTVELSSGGSGGGGADAEAGRAPHEGGDHQEGGAPPHDDGGYGGEDSTGSQPPPPSGGGGDAGSWEGGYGGRDAPTKGYYHDEAGGMPDAHPLAPAGS